MTRTSVAQLARLLTMSDAAKRRYAAKKPETPKTGRERRTFSPEARAKMAEAARRRWAKVRGETVQTAT